MRLVLLLLLFVGQAWMVESRSAEPSPSASEGTQRELQYLSELVRPGRVPVRELSVHSVWGAMEGMDIAVLSYVNSGGAVPSQDEAYASEIVVYQRGTHKIQGIYHSEANYRRGDTLRIMEPTYRLGPNTIAFGIQVERPQYLSTLSARTASDVRLSLYVLERGNLRCALDAFKTEENLIADHPTSEAPSIRVSRTLSAYESADYDFYPLVVTEKHVKTLREPPCDGDCMQSEERTYKLLHAGSAYLPENFGLYKELVYSVDDRSNRMGSETSWKSIPNTRLSYKQVASQDCGGKFCGEFGGMVAEDTATGKLFDPRKILTRRGEKDLSDKFKVTILARAKEILATAIKDGTVTKVDPYLLTQCRKNWNTLPNSLEPIGTGVSSTGDIVLEASACGWHIVGYDLFDRLTQSFSPKELEPYLNSYGRSVLLGEGRVLEPEVESFECKSVAAVVAPTLPHGGIAEVRSSPDIFAVLYKDEQLWVLASSRQSDTLRPVRIKGSFIHIETTPRNLFGLMRDGSLWRWTTSDAEIARNEIAPKGQFQPKIVGENFVDVIAGIAYGRAIALKRDGTVWMWHDDAPGPSFSDVTKATQGVTLVAQGASAIHLTRMGKIGVLKPDGKLYEYDPERVAALPASSLVSGQIPGQLVGYGYSGFVKPSRFTKGAMDGAKRNDESLWDWSVFGDPTKLAANVLQTLGISSSVPVSAVLQRDGKLLVGTRRGGAWLFPIGCGYTDVGFSEGYQLPISNPVSESYLLALKATGELVAWNPRNAETKKSALEIADSSPIILGKGFMSLPIWIENIDTASRSFSGVVVFKTDGSLWIRYHDISRPVAPAPIDALFTKLFDRFAE